jgi:Outer membrane protein beta-barrel domain
MKRLSIALSAALLCTVPAVTSAQTTSAWGTNGYISFNGLYQAGADSYDINSLQDVDHEAAHITATQELGKHVLAGDITAGGRIRGNLGIGFGFTFSRDTHDATVTGTVPHPFYFDQPRQLNDSTGLRREDLAIHMSGMWLLPITESFQMSVFGGPTWFQVKHQAIQTTTFEESYPFDDVALDQVTLEERKGTRWGYNVGADASYFFSEYLGVQGLARYSKATISIGPDDNKSSVEAGGLQVGGGLRVRF